MFFESKTIKIDRRKVTFTGRDQALLILLSQGETPHTIAESAEVSVSTVYNQLHSLLAKLRIRSYEKAVRKARRIGLLADYDKRVVEER